MDAGQIVVANRNAGTLSIIDVATDKKLFDIELPQGPNEATPEPMYLVYLSQTDEIIVGDRTNDRLVAFNRKNYSLSALVPVGEGVFHCWADPDEEQLWVTNDIDNTISVIDIESKQVIATIPLASELGEAGGQVHDVFLDPVTDFAYVSVLNVEGEEDVVIKYSRDDFEEVDRALVGNDPHLSATATNDVLYVASQEANQLSILDRETLDLVSELEIPGAHGAVMAFDRESYRYFYTTNISGGGPEGLYTVDTESNLIVGEPVDTPFPTPHNIALSAKGDKLYVTHSGATADQVSTYKVGEDGVPIPLETVATDANPFGLVSVAPSTNPENNIISKVLLGTEGKDRLVGDNGNTEIFGDGGKDLLIGDSRRSPRNLVGGNDILHGGDGNDRIRGNGGDDTLFGDAGQDRLFGDAGDDVLWGGLGNDILRGDSKRSESGRDTFVLAAGKGRDLIRDFEVGLDYIGLADGLTFGDLIFRQRGKHTFIETESDRLALVRGVNAEAFIEDMFKPVSL